MKNLPRYEITDFWTAVAISGGLGTLMNYGIPTTVNVGGIALLIAIMSAALAILSVYPKRDAK